MYHDDDLGPLGCAFGCIVVLAVLVLLAVGVTLGRCSAKVEPKTQDTGDTQ